MTMVSRAQRVLVLTSDWTLADFITRCLGLRGHLVDVEAEGLVGVRRVFTDPPDLVVMQAGLAPIDGVELCRRLRMLSPVPVVMLLDRASEADGITALELGADDYMTEPFSSDVLTARVGAVLRRTTGTVIGTVPMRLHAGGVDVDVVAHETRVDGKVVALSPKEFALLVHFMRNPRRVFRREELLEEVWGLRDRATSTITVHVRWLRAKIEHDPSNPRHIKTVWRLGYRFDP
jgi:DNA-binding response OmpR family regulator